MTPIARGLSFLALAALVADAHASEVYDIISGSSSVITLQVFSSSGTLLMSGSNSIPLTAPSEITVDFAGMQIPTFAFEDVGTSTIAFSGPFSGDSIQLTNATVTPGSPYSSSLTGSNPNYNYSLGAVQGSVSSWAFFQGTTLKSSGGAISGSTAGPLTGALTINGDSTITLDGIVLGDVVIGGQTDVIKADVTFAGAPVPLPPSIALLASALLGLGMVSLRRRTLTRISFETDSRRLI
jgi:hypothetical protein